MGTFLEKLMESHSKIARDKLGHLYHLQPALDLLRMYPIESSEAFTDYASLFPRFFSLNSREIAIIDRVSSLMDDKTRKSAASFRRAFSGHEGSLCNTILTIADPGTDIYRKGINTLAIMMTNAWDMKVDGIKPVDGDKRSNVTIWGHVLGAENPWLDIHFTIAHLTERVLTARLAGTPLENLTTEKDWSFPVSTAIVGLDGLRNIGVGSKFLPFWRLPRPKGLGWISERRIQLFTQTLYE